MSTLRITNADYEAEPLRSFVSRALIGRELFSKAQINGARPCLGDVALFRAMRTMAQACVPLVSIEGEPSSIDLGGRQLAITGAGRDVAAGRQDAVTLNGVDRWRGGAVRPETSRRGAGIHGAKRWYH